MCIYINKRGYMSAELFSVKLFILTFICLSHLFGKYYRDNCFWGYDNATNNFAFGKGCSTERENPSEQNSLVASKKTRRGMPGNIVITFASWKYL